MADFGQLFELHVVESRKKLFEDCSRDPVVSQEEEPHTKAVVPKMQPLTLNRIDEMTLEDCY